jgi:hypothetical protein
MAGLVSGTCYWRRNGPGARLASVNVKATPPRVGACVCVRRVMLSDDAYAGSSKNVPVAAGRPWRGPWVAICEDRCMRRALTFNRFQKSPDPGVIMQDGITLREPGRRKRRL